MNVMKVKKVLIFLTVVLVSACNPKIKEDGLQIVLPETYELTNIILALTDYAIEDPSEVMKGTSYYKEVMEYFEPVRDHPLLDSVNYSRKLWEDYLAFRTDGFAFAFDENNKLKRVLNFYSMGRGRTPLDNHLELVNDFVEKSGFRDFFQSKREFYDYLVDNYKAYYLVDEMKNFLDEKVGRSNSIFSKAGRNFVVLSPLVGRMNCHRGIDRNTDANFSAASREFMNEFGGSRDMEIRITNSHILFTEMDHGYINPISDRYAKLIADNFNTDIWDLDSGYPGINCFNEYMTWAVYTLFIKEQYPEYNVDSIAVQWQFQNSSRGFFAQNLFTDKVTELYFNRGDRSFETIYEPLLTWCKSIENNVSLPTLVNVGSDKFLPVKEGVVELVFSEPMKTGSPFGIILREIDSEGKGIGENINITVHNAEWSEDGKTVRFKIESRYERYMISLNWWGVGKPLVSANGIFLKTQDCVLQEL